MKTQITIFNVDEPVDAADCMAGALAGLGLTVTKEIGDNGAEWVYTIESGQRLNYTAQYSPADAMEWKDANLGGIVDKL